MTAIERPLMRSQGDFRCSSCFYFEMAETSSEVTQTVPYCNRRERQIGWNPLMFLCSDFGTKCKNMAVQTSLDWRWRRVNK